jgi:hypothetical protein
MNPSREQAPQIHRLEINGPFAREAGPGGRERVGEITSAASLPCGRRAPVALYIRREVATPGR